MTILKPECVAIHSKKQFSVSEKRSKVDFKNPNLYEIREITVDKCVVTEGIRCDYLIIADDPDVSALVELKGSDVEHAIEQLKSTHILLLEHCKKSKYWIVSSTRNPLSSTEIQFFKVKIKRLFKVDLIIGNSPVQHKF